MTTAARRHEIFVVRRRQRFELFCEQCAAVAKFVTLDSAVLSPTDAPGVYRLNTRAAILDGTGIYAGANGSLNIHGTINLISGVVDWRFEGRAGGA